MNLVFRFDTRLKVGLVGDRKRREKRSMRFMKLFTNNAKLQTFTSTAYHTTKQST